MRRRSFLKSVASAFSIAVSQPFILAMESSAPSSEEHVVLAGQDRFGEARSLGFSQIGFKTTTADSGGNLFVIEHSNLKPGGPPLHFHLAQEEWFYVMEGEVLFQIGEKRMQLKAGDSVMAPRKVPHAFTAVGANPAKLLIAFSPAGKIEQFFIDAPKETGALQNPALFAKYEMKVVGPPLQAAHTALSN
jgi:mannose-6-phosphate isomerase-like protein (cupin superfamily)